jgi:hypothetical protein
LAAQQSRERVGFFLAEIEHISGRWVRLPKDASPRSATGKVRLMFAPGQ